MQPGFKDSMHVRDLNNLSQPQLVPAPLEEFDHVNTGLQRLLSLTARQLGRVKVPCSASLKTRSPGTLGRRADRGFTGRSGDHPGLNFITASQAQKKKPRPIRSGSAQPGPERPCRAQPVNRELALEDGLAGRQTSSGSQSFQKEEARRVTDRASRNRG
jgi:hypothetical protein